jgi:hypothetical protein
MPTGGLSSDRSTGRYNGNNHNSLPGSTRTGSDSPPSTITPRTPMSNISSARSDGGDDHDESAPASAMGSARRDDHLVATINNNAAIQAAAKLAASQAVATASATVTATTTVTSPGQPLDTPSPFVASLSSTGTPQPSHVVVTTPAL